MIETGLSPLAAPTARTALGLPMDRARSPYETVWPNGMTVSSVQTWRWNSVPESCSGRSNSFREPSKYSDICLTPSAHTTVEVTSDRRSSTKKSEVIPSFVPPTSMRPIGES